MNKITMDRYTQFVHFIILSPRWWDKRILLNNAKIGTYNKVVVTDMDKDGNRYFPPLYISGKDARKYKVESNGVINCRSIPIEAFQELELAKRSLLEVI